MDIPDPLPNFTEWCNKQIELDIKQIVADNPSNAKPFKLESDAIYEQRVRRDLKMNYENVQKQLVHGARLLQEALQELNKQDPQSFPSEALEDYNQLAKAVENLNQHPEKQAKLLEEGLTLCEVFNISEESQQVFDKIVHHFMSEQRFEEAHDMLALLLGLNPKRTEGWLDLGYLQYKLERYEEALESYYVATLGAEDDIRPFFYSISCYLKLGRKDNAREIIELLSKALSNESESDNPWVAKLESFKSQV